MGWLTRSKNKKPLNTGTASAFAASDNIKYRRYRNRLAGENSKVVPLSKKKWAGEGRPEN